MRAVIRTGAVWAGCLLFLIAAPVWADFSLTLGAAHDQGWPGLTFGGGQYFAAWHDYREGNLDPRIFAARVTPQGEIIDPQGIPLSPQANHAAYYPNVAFSGDNYLVVWQKDC
jgi:hypothetical protein